MIDTDNSTLVQIQDAYGKLPTAKEFFYDWYGANEWFFKTINSLHAPSYDAFMLYITKLGDYHFFLPYLLILGIYALLSLLWRKIRGKAGVKQHLIMWIGAFLLLGAAAVANHIVISGLKEYFQYPRPYVILPSSDVIMLEAATAEDARHSFPSSHVAFITMMIVGLWSLLSHHMRLLGLFLIALVAWSRIAVGMHFPADTIGAFLISGGVVIAVRSVLYTLLRKLFGMNCGGG